MPAHPNTHTSTAVQALPAPVVVMQAMMAKSSLIRASWRQAGAQASRQPPQTLKVSTGGFKCYPLTHTTLLLKPSRRRRPMHVPL